MPIIRFNYQHQPLLVSQSVKYLHSHYAYYQSQLSRSTSAWGDAEVSEKSWVIARTFSRYTNLTQPSSYKMMMNMSWIHSYIFVFLLVFLLRTFLVDPARFLSVALGGPSSTDQISCEEFLHFHPLDLMLLHPHPSPQHNISISLPIKLAHIIQCRYLPFYQVSCHEPPLSFGMHH